MKLRWVMLSRCLFELVFDIQVLNEPPNRAVWPLVHV